jgi:26S proteasome regulatory subunit (ATPase 3-interacting protein)
MAPRAPKSKVDGDGPLKQKAEKAKISKVKTEKLEKLKGNKKERGKGDKIKPVTGDGAVDLIAEYLRTQNRPYSATEISANLHGKVSSQMHCLRTPICQL